MPQPCNIFPSRCYFKIKVHTKYQHPFSPLPALPGSGRLALSEQDSLLPKHYIYSGKFLKDGQKNSLAVTSLLSQSINTETKIRHENAIRSSLGTSVARHLPAAHYRPRDLSLPVLNAKPSLRSMRTGSVSPERSLPENICLSPEASESIANSMAHSYDTNATHDDSQYFLATTMRQRQRNRQWSLSGIEDCDSEMLIQSIRGPLPAPRNNFHANRVKKTRQHLPPLSNPFS